VTARAPQLSLPQGGGAVSGLGETFQPDLFTGTGRFTVPFDVPSGRNGFSPGVALTYSSGTANGPFGLGWTLGVGAIARSTRRGVPRYDDTDVFVLDAGEDLVPVAGGAPGRQRYRPRVESAYSRIEHITQGGQDYWEVRGGGGFVHRYGSVRPPGAPAEWRDQAVLRDPANPTRIGAWRLSRTTDACGNAISYRYLRDPEGDARGFDELYLEEVRWVDHGSFEDPEFLVRVAFAYESRADVVTSRRLGFPMTTALRCSRIETSMHHVEPALTARRWDISYVTAPGNGLSLLSAITVTGIDGDATASLPPLSFSYSEFSPQGRRFVPVTADADAMPPFSLAHPDVELVDVDGSGLPSVIQIAGVARVWRNGGAATLSRPHSLPLAAPVPGLAAAGVSLGDADGDGRTDLMVSGPGRVAGYFPLAADGTPSDFVRWERVPPFALDAPDVRLIDLDGDGINDCLRLGASAMIARAQARGGWSAAQRPGGDVPPVSFLNPRVKVADMSGDGLTDIVLVGNRSVSYWPARGYGRWERTPITMTSAPALPNGAQFEPQRLLLGDVDGDGLADAIYVADGTVTVWINRSGREFAAGVTIPGTPRIVSGDSIRLMDLLGTGTAGVLWTSDAGARHGSNYWFLNLTGAVKPYLLNGIDNHMGATTTIEYGPSTRFLIADRAAGRPWRTQLPFPVQVVTRVTVEEQFTGARTTSEFSYHHGHWDGAEREFRGFGRVDRRDASAVLEPGTPRMPLPDGAPPSLRAGDAPPTVPIIHRGENFVRNPDFAQGDGGRLVVTDADGPSAVEDWAVRNAGDRTVTERSLAADGTPSLHVDCDAAGSALVQAVGPPGHGPPNGVLAVRISVERGSVALETSDGEARMPVALASHGPDWQAIRTTTGAHPVSELAVRCTSAGGATFRLASVTLQPILSGNLLGNADFSADGAGGSARLEGPLRSGPSAATSWSVWNGSDAVTTTELVATSRPGAAGRMLRVRSTGDGCGVVQTFLTPAAGPVAARASAWVLVTRGAVAIGTGDAGRTGRDAVARAADGWQLIQADNSVAPANELAIHAADPGGADFCVDAAWVTERDPVAPPEYSPPVETRTWFHVGPVGPPEGAWTELDLTDETWPEDPPLFPAPDDARTNTALPRSARRAAARALHGRVLRTEVYVLDGTQRQSRPMTVTEYEHAVTPAASTGAAATARRPARTQLEAAPPEAGAAVFFPHERGRRATQWERGRDPHTRATFTGCFDAYGRSHLSLDVGVPRGRDPRSAKANGAEPYLATEKWRAYATRDGDDALLLDRVCGAAGFETVNDGSLSLVGLRDAVTADRAPPPRLMTAEFTFFDGEAFTGLPYGQIGTRGLATRSERLMLTRGVLAELSDGHEVPYLWPASGDGRGVLGEYFRDAELTEPLFRRIDAGIGVDRRHGPDPVVDPGRFGVRWSGDITATVTGPHTLAVESVGGVRLWIGGHLIIDASGGTGAAAKHSARVELVSGEPVEMRLEYARRAHGDGVRFTWAPPGRSEAEVPLEALQVPADAAPAWTADYPQRFRDSIPPLAGYRYRSAGRDGSHVWDGYYAVAGQRFDVHDAGEGRGLATVIREALHRDTVVEYDAYDFLPTAVTDPAGLVTTATYDYRVLKPVVCTDPNGTASRAAYTPTGQLAAVWRRGDGDQQPATRFIYDLDGAAASPPRPPSVHTVRRVEHRATIVREENARRDREGRPPLTSAEEEALFPPDELGRHPERFIQVRDISDGLGRLLQTRAETTPVRFGTVDATDDDAALASSQEAQPQPAVGRPVAGTAVLVSGWVVRDNKGRAVHAYDPFVATGFAFDPDEARGSRRRVTTRYDALGRLVGVVAADGSESLTVRGVPGSIADPRMEFPSVHEPSPWEIYSYDANDNAGRTHPLVAGGWWTHWNTPQSQRLDALGRPLATVVRGGGSAPDIETTMRFDAGGNPIEMIDSLGRTGVSTRYDLAGRPWRSALLDAGVTRRVLDAAGAAVERRDAKGSVVLHGFDGAHRPTHDWACDRPGATPTLRQRTLYGDDAADAALDPAAAKAANLLGRPYMLCDEAGMLRNEAFDDDGNLSRRTRMVLREDLLLAALDAGGRYTADWEPLAGTSFSAHLTTQVDLSQYTVSGVHDALGRLRRETRPAAHDGTRSVLAFEHDPQGRVTAVSLDGQRFVDRIAYDAHGRCILLARGNGVMSRFAYDNVTLRLIRSRSERHRADGLTYAPVADDSFEDVRYGFDLVADVLAARSRGADVGTSPTPDALDRRFEYDPHYRIVFASGRESSVAPPDPWDAAPRSADPTLTARYRERYTYDEAHNLTAVSHTGGSGDWTRRLDPDPSNSRIAAMVNGAATVTYRPDRCGNVLSEGTSRHFSWDWSDRLVGFRIQAGDGPASVTADYRYDSNGYRVHKVVRKGPGLYETCVAIGGGYERRRRVAATTVDNVELHVAAGTARIARVRVGPAFPDDATPAIAHELIDHLGTVTVTLDGDGRFVSREEYSPWGETTFGGYARKRYRFTGKERDEESGLSNHGLRFYAPWLGRWMSADPAAPSGPHSPFRYGANNPMRYVDPAGAADEDAVAPKSAVVSPANTGPSGTQAHGEVLPELARRVNENPALREFYSAEVEVRTRAGGSSKAGSWAPGEIDLSIRTGGRGEHIYDLKPQGTSGAYRDQVFNYTQTKETVFSSKPGTVLRELAVAHPEILDPVIVGDRMYLLRLPPENGFIEYTVVRTVPVKNPAVSYRPGGGAKGFATVEGACTVAGIGLTLYSLYQTDKALEAAYERSIATNSPKPLEDEIRLQTASWGTGIAVGTAGHAVLAPFLAKLGSLGGPVGFLGGLVIGGTASWAGGKVAEAEIAKEERAARDPEYAAKRAHIEGFLDSAYRFGF
jgi:RHS repeat-associated protein